MPLYNAVSQCADHASGTLYLAVTDTVTGASGILAHHPLTGTRWVVNDLHCSGTTLALSRATRMWVNGDSICFTGGTNPPRAVSRTKTYAAGSLAAADLSMVAEPPTLPPVITDATDSALGYTPVQKMGFQVAVSYIYDDKTVSVLGPYSKTRPPSDPSLVANNVADINPLVGEAIPDCVAEIELCYRNMDDPGYHGVIKRWKRSDPTDAAAMAAHNAGSAPLQFRWDGVGVIETLPAERTDITFSNMPHRAVSGCAIENRNVLAGTVTGYSTPAAKTAISVTRQDSAMYVSAAPFQVQGYYLWYKPEGDNKDAVRYYCYVLRYNGVTYIIDGVGYSGSYTADWGIEYKGPGPYPYMFPVGRKNKDTPKQVFFAPDLIVPKSRLRKALQQGDFTNMAMGVDWRKAVAAKLVVDATGAPIAAGAGDIAILGAEFYLVDEVPDHLVTRSGNYAPDTRYRYGIQFRDAARRACGSIDIGTALAASGTITRAPFWETMPLTESFTFSLPTGPQSNVIPNWADTYSIIMSPPVNRTLGVYGYGYGLRRAYRTPDGSLTLNRTEYEGGQLAGIAIPIDALARDRKGYAYKEGDKCDLYVGDSVLTGEPAAYKATGEIIGSQAGYVIVARFAGKTIEQIADDVCMRSYPVYYPYANEMALGYLAEIALGQNGPSYVWELMNPIVPCDRYGVARPTWFNLYETPQTQAPLYEVGHTYRINRTSGGVGSFSNTSITITGGHYRALCYDNMALLPSGSPYTSAGITQSNSHYGRECPPDSVGQVRLTGNIMWTEPAIPGASRSGAAMVLPASFRTLDASKGAITALAVPSNAMTDGGTILALCETGAWAIAIGRTALTTADGGTVLAASKDFISAVQNAGSNGCISPLSVASDGQHVLWYDAAGRALVHWDGSGLPTPATGDTVRAALRQAAGGLTPSQTADLAGGVCPDSGEYFLCFPATAAAGSNNLPTTNEQNPFDLWPKHTAAAMVYNYKAKQMVGAWCGRGTDPAPISLYATVGKSLYAYWQGKLYEEFTGGGLYYGQSVAGTTAGIVVAFAADYPTTKEPRGLITDSTSAPGRTWLASEGQQSVTDVWKWGQQEGEWYADVRRDRLAGNPTADATIGGQKGVSGKPVRAKSLLVFVGWAVSVGLKVRAVMMKWNRSSGH